MSKRVEFDEWTEEDGFMYLDTSSPSEYEPEPIIALLGVDPNSEEAKKVFEDQAKRYQTPK
ncbi:hypothetical protein [Nostoc sp. FACHB-133]|uniref:hypothetical protein n=1 Tax=Nostoc sp. FACHB-133 TaxID=2692835 RepID=UPI00168904F1|nr:hypothetical protein [Nostoc sp. FACHB-133]MBD2527656.1 hypothetical protein [Nostoc sp. FACHB-133]